MKTDYRTIDRADILVVLLAFLTVALYLLEAA
jgi:hypothetical protein